MTTLIIDADTILYPACYGEVQADVAYDKAIKKINWIKDQYWATNDQTFCYIKGSSNFRNDVFPDYKNTPSRIKAREDSSIVDELYSIIEERDEGIFIPADGMEADDMVRIKANEVKKGYVIVTIDKDLQCIPGEFFNPRTEEVFHVSEKEANKHYYKQLLTGDATDNIRGLHRVGPVTAEKWLNQTRDYKDLVLTKYKAAFDNDYEDVITFVGSLIHILRKEYDYFDIGFKDWFSKDRDLEAVVKKLGY